MKRSSKRRRMPGKKTYSELRDEHPELAAEILRKRNAAPGYMFFKRVPRTRRYLTT